MKGIASSFSVQNDSHAGSRARADRANRQARKKGIQILPDSLMNFSSVHNLHLNQTYFFNDNKKTFLEMGYIIVSYFDFYEKNYDFILSFSCHLGSNKGCIGL